MPRPLLTVLAAPGSRDAPDQNVRGVQCLELPDAGAATLDAALGSALAPVAIVLAAGETLGPDAAAAAEAAARTAHRSWWWAADGPALAGRAPHREDLAWLLLAHARPLPVTLFRPGAVLSSGGFARHGGPAFRYAHACRQLACRTLPGRCEPVLGTPTRLADALGDDELRDRAEVSRSFADRCHPHDRDAVWHACEATLAATGETAPSVVRRAA